MAYKDKIAQTANGIKEAKSVLLIETMLVEKAKTDIVRDNTQASIDGYIHLLDGQNKGCGKLTVQVKTVNKRDEGLNRYPCPTSLFAYAENNPDNVFLLAVDHSQNKILFKHISHKLLKDNRDKEDQDTITLYFSKDEELKSDNVDEVVALWRSICKDKVIFFDTASSIKEENELLKAELLKRPEYINTFSESDIKELQNFSDSYNELLNNTFNYIKRIHFPNVWKRGIAVYAYSDSSLEYSLFNIKEGELLPPIMQLPPVSATGITYKHDYVSLSCVDNVIKKDPRNCACSLIKKHVDDFIKSMRIIPSDEIFLIEYIYEFIEANWRRLHLKKYSDLDVHSLIQHFQSKYPYIDRMPVQLISSGKSIYINTVYEAIKRLSDIGYTSIPYPYPKKEPYGNTGMVYDFFSPATALEKSRIVIVNTIRAYQNFIQSEFPLLANELDVFYGGNLISVLVDYSNPGHKSIFHIYYFRSIVSSNEKIITIEEVRNSRIMQENNFASASDLFVKESVKFNGKKFSAFRSGRLNDMTILFGKYNCLTYFYELLKEHFDDFFKKRGL